MTSQRNYIVSYSTHDKTDHWQDVLTETELKEIIGEIVLDGEAWLQHDSLENDILTLTWRKESEIVDASLIQELIQLDLVS